jgi:hypothetical protein
MKMSGGTDCWIVLFEYPGCCCRKKSVNVFECMRLMQKRSCNRCQSVWKLLFLRSNFPGTGKAHREELRERESVKLQSSDSILAVNAKRNTCKATCSSYYRQSLPQHWSACFPVSCEILFSKEAWCCRCKHQLWNRILFHLFSVFWSSQLRGLLQSLPTPYVVIASALK